MHASANSKFFFLAHVLLQLLILGSGTEIEEVCRVGLSALALPAVAVFPDPKQAAAHARVRTTSPPTSRRESAAAAAAKTSATSGNNSSGSSAASQKAERKSKQSSSSSVGAGGAATTAGEAADVDSGGNGGAATFILQLAVVLLEDEVDMVDIGVRAGEALGSQTTAAAAAGRRRGRGEKADGVVARDGEGEASSLPLLAAMVDRAGESGRVLRVTLPHYVGPQHGAVEERDDGEQHGQVIFFPHSNIFFLLHVPIYCGVSLSFVTYTFCGRITSCKGEYTCLYICHEWLIEWILDLLFVAYSLVLDEFSRDHNRSAPRRRICSYAPPTIGG